MESFHLKVSTLEMILFSFLRDFFRKKKKKADIRFVYGTPLDLRRTVTN